VSSLTHETAERFATLALSHVEREFPNKLDHVLGGPEDALTPRALHPIFFGSFDWHSCVHAYWLLARLMRRFPDLSGAPQIATLFATRLTAANLAAECAYLDRPLERAFERPYGWAWLLALQTELDAASNAAARAAAAVLRPLSAAFAARFAAYLPLADYPIRTGTHFSTAFALRLAADYAQSSQPELFTLLRAKALTWYGDDADAQAWEPSQDDFLSPTLIEAECMRRLLSAQEFRAWFSRFLPQAAASQPVALFTPARVSDRSDDKIVHLDGLNLSRAWCWRSLALAAGRDSALGTQLLATAEEHIAASLPHVAGDYSGEHWLATFATLALDGL
jgi:hypothetical protein